MPDTPSFLIQGDTYKHREKLKELGGQWDAQMKGWRMPPETYDEARLIVDNCTGQLALTDWLESRTT